MHHRPYPVPELPGGHAPMSQLPIQEFFHTPGQAAAIRFFEPYSESDLLAMREILRAKQVRKWMDDASTISRSDYEDWAGDYSKYMYLFSVHDTRVQDPELMKVVRGFIYLYSEREEKFRVKRMEKLGFLQPTQARRYTLEVSFAARPMPVGLESAPGLMSSALRASCLQVQMLLEAPDNPEVIIFGFVDPENLPAQRTLEASGFVKTGMMRYSWDSYKDTVLYILSWPLLHAKIREKLLQALQAQRAEIPREEHPLQPTV